MSKRKQGISANRYIEIGAQLSAMRDALVHLEVELGNAYPRSGPKARIARALTKARIALDDVRNHGDSMSCDEYPQLWCSHWYYPRDWEKHGEMPHACGINQSKMFGTDIDAIYQWCSENGTVPGPGPQEK